MARAFGEHRPDALLEIPKNELPPEALIPETVIHAEGSKGQSINGTVLEVKENTVLVDFNHPLAGQELYCTVHIIDVQ